MITFKFILNVLFFPQCCLYKKCFCLVLQPQCLNFWSVGKKNIFFLNCFEL